MQVDPPALLEADAGDDGFPPNIMIENLPGLEHTGSAESRSGSHACPLPAPPWTAVPLRTHPSPQTSHGEGAMHALGGADFQGGTLLQTAPQPCASHFRPLPGAQVAANGPGRGIMAALEAPQSMWARPSDPDMAEEVEGHPHGGNVTAAQFEFHKLEFLRPSRMVRPVCMRMHACTHA